MGLLSQRVALFALFPFAMAATSLVLFTHPLFEIGNVPASGTIGSQIVFCVAVFVLAALGALAGLLPFRRNLPSAKSIGGLAGTFSVASFFVLLFVYSLGGLVAVGLWLVLGAAVFSAGSVWLG